MSCNLNSAAHEREREREVCVCVCMEPAQKDTTSYQRIALTGRF